MFKRRKPDEPANPEIALPPSPAAGGRQLDSGLGMPPRPAPPKDAQPMSRPPFPATPPPTPQQASGQGQQGQGQQGQGQQPGQRPGPQPARSPVERRTLVVGRGISVQGVIQDAERLVVEGIVEATNIHATELAIAPGGMFRGEVEVEDAEVAGTIDGTLTARGNLSIRATGKVLGTARCRRLQVEDGGQITGQIEMITEPRAAEPAPQRAQADVAG